MQTTFRYIRNCYWIQSVAIRYSLSGTHDCVVRWRVRWTTADLGLFAGERSHRYEIIDGELFVTRAPHWKHQAICINIGTALKIWSDESGLGEPAITPGIIFSDADNVIPDVVWATHERLEHLLDDAGHLTAAPE